MDDRQQHWDQVYLTKSSDEVSWYQEEPTTSLAMIDRSGGSSILDVGGGASRLVDHLLERGLTDVTVLDISQAALDAARARLGARADRVKWIAGDVTTAALEQRYDVWHDRAVFHFLTDPEARLGYRRTLLGALRAGGHAIVATFALDGPERCSGLPVERYSPETLSAELAPELTLLETQNEEHVTPAGKVQRFVYCRFRRAS